MQAGKLRHRITVQADQADPETPGPDGTVTPDWQPTHTDRAAEVLAVSGGERIRGGIQVAATTEFVVTTRYAANITTESRIVWNGRTLGISSVRDLDGRRRTLLIECTSTH